MSSPAFCSPPLQIDSTEVNRLPRGQRPETIGVDADRSQSLAQEEWLLAHLETIDQISARVSRRFRFEPPDAEDFASIVRLRLIERNYAILRSFQGRSNWSTYLTRVILNLGREFLNKKSGKWRPSKKARDLGVLAVELETLCFRDGLSWRHAVEFLVMKYRGSITRSELLKLQAQLPVRIRRRFVGEELLLQLAVPGDAEGHLEDKERSTILSSIEAALMEVLPSLPEQDFAVLRLHYGEGLKFTEVAKVCGLSQRKTYTVHLRCLRRLRRGLEKRGLRGREIRCLLGWPVDQLRIDFEGCDRRLAARSLVGAGSSGLTAS